MVNIVENLVGELEGKGWLATHAEGKLTFARNEVTITGYQEHVTVEIEGAVISDSEGASRYWSTMERLQFLVTQIRQIAEMADTGQLEQMARWMSVQNVICQSTWEHTLRCPEALLLIEEVVGMLIQAQ